ncbi:MAG: hypothetical protein ABW212_04070 [Pseudonocardia sediminis]
MVGHTVHVEPSGELAAVDTSEAARLMPMLLGGDTGALDAVLARPQRQMPPVLFAAAALLHARGSHAEGAAWFYAAQVRARFDANRCTDPTAAGALDVLRERFGEPINRWAFTGRDRVRRAAITGVAWDRRAPHDYDHRWIALHGMGAFGPQRGPVSVPAAQWPALAARTRAEYLTGLREAVREYLS